MTIFLQEARLTSIQISEVLNHAGGFKNFCCRSQRDGRIGSCQNTWITGLCQPSAPVESWTRSLQSSGVKRLLFLGSTCIYPKFAPQPMKEEWNVKCEMWRVGENSWNVKREMWRVKKAFIHISPFTFHKILKGEGWGKTRETWNVRLEKAFIHISPFTFHKILKGEGWGKTRETWNVKGEKGFYSHFTLHVSQDFKGWMVNG